MDWDKSGESVREQLTEKLKTERAHLLESLSTCPLDKILHTQGRLEQLRLLLSEIEDTRK